MKNSTSFFFIILVSAILININCNPEIPERNNNQAPILPPPPPPPQPINQTIWADANMNITIEWPMNFVILSGDVSGPENNGAKYKWEKISGPASYLLEKQDSLKTKVNNLEKGIYQFKLTATSISGQTSSDTMTVKVQDATSPNKQIFFWNINWVCPFECSILLRDVFSYMPVNSSFTLYIRREFSSNWELIVPDSVSSTARYIYSVWNGQISVFENSNADATDHPEIKLVF